MEITEPPFEATVMQDATSEVHRTLCTRADQAKQGRSQSCMHITSMHVRNKVSCNMFSVKVQESEWKTMLDGAAFG